MERKYYVSIRIADDGRGMDMTVEADRAGVIIPSRKVSMENGRMLPKATEVRAKDSFHDSDGSHSAELSETDRAGDSPISNLSFPSAAAMLGRGHRSWRRSGVLLHKIPQAAESRPCDIRGKSIRIV
jgi:hypothetical protein